MDKTMTIEEHDNSNDDDDSVTMLLQQATQLETKAIQDFKKNYHGLALDKWKTALMIRTSILGMNHWTTVNLFQGIAEGYYQMGYQNTAIGAWHVYCRRQSCWNMISPSSLHKPLCDIRWFSQALTRKCNWNEEQLQYYEENVSLSVAVEYSGDEKRQRGEYIGALEDYEKALRLEKQFGFVVETTPIVAHLSRKIACLLGQRHRPSEDDSSPVLHPIVDVDWAMVDLLNHKWLQDPTNGLYPTVCEAIREGDQHLTQLNCAGAMKEYTRAAQIAKDLVSCDDDSKVVQNIEGDLVPCDDDPHSSTTTMTRTNVPYQSSRGGGEMILHPLYYSMEHDLVLQTQATEKQVQQLQKTVHLVQQAVFFLVVLFVLLVGIYMSRIHGRLTTMARVLSRLLQEGTLSEVRFPFFRVRNAAPIRTTTIIPESSFSQECLFDEKFVLFGELESDCPMNDLTSQIENILLEAMASPTFLWGVMATVGMVGIWFKRRQLRRGINFSPSRDREWSEPI